MVVFGVMSPVVWEDLGGRQDTLFWYPVSFRAKKSCQEKLSQLWTLTSHAFPLLYSGYFERKKKIPKGKQQNHKLL